MMKALVIEDDPQLAQAMELMLSREGFKVETTDLGEEGLELARFYEHDIILLDLTLPDMRGHDVLKRLRAARVHTPVVIVSGMSDIDSKVCCLTCGADDYLTKPFQREELISRIRAVVRRAHGHAQPRIRIGRLTVNIDAKVADVDGEVVPLTCKEFEMLELLALRKGATLTKDMFLNHLYGGLEEPDGKIIDVFICKLRKKLTRACGGVNYIKTIWGRGYKLVEPEEVSLAA